LALGVSGAASSQPAPDRSTAALAAATATADSTASAATVKSTPRSAAKPTAPQRAARTTPVAPNRDAAAPDLATPDAATPDLAALDAAPRGRAGARQRNVAAEVAALEPAASLPRRAARRADEVDLGTTSITGNQELPKVLYIVPWKRSDLGDLVGRPVNTLLDEVLSPVDPDVFKRHLEYYDALFEPSSQSGAGAGDRKE
jgi:hypothetical protein